MRRCWFGMHALEVDDWDAEVGLLRCIRCQHIVPMSGEVLVAWIHHRTLMRERNKG